MSDLSPLPLVLTASHRLYRSAMPDAPVIPARPRRRAPPGVAAAPAGRPTREGVTVRYMMLVCVDESVEVSEAEGSPTAWVEEMEARGVRKFGSRLRPVSDATTVQVRGGEVVLSDGPFAETKEQVGGFDLIDCRDLDEAIEVASKHPAAKFGTIEVRPLWEE